QPPARAFVPYDDCKVDNILQGNPDGLPYSPYVSFALNNSAAFATNTPSAIFGNGRNYDVANTGLGVLSTDYDIVPGLTVTSVTAYSYAKVIDAGRSSFAFGSLDIGSESKNHELSEELRLTSDWKDSWINFMVGGLYNAALKKDHLAINYGLST